MDISVVIPLFNEKENIGILYEKLKEVLSSLEKSYEIILVDDHSTDNTFDTIKKLHEQDKNVKVIRFRKNFGQTAALQAGFDIATGGIIVTMDGDLQNDPDDIPKLLKKMDEGYDVVSGWRSNRKDSLIGKIIPSWISNYIANRLTGLNIHDFGCSLKAYKKETLKDIELYGEMHRYLLALIAMNGFSIGEVEVTHNKRIYGRSKYGFRRLLKGILDLMYIKFWSDYRTRPLHFFGLLGLMQLILGAIIGFYKVFIELFYFKVPLNVGPLLLLSVLLIITGIQCVIFGFLGEILIRTYYSKSGHAGFEIEEILD